METTYAGKITQINTMINALKEADEQLTHHFSATFITNMEQQFNAIMELDAEHEATKSMMKETTVKMESLLAELIKNYRYARDVVKLELPQESWLTYGCKAKRK